MTSNRAVFQQFAVAPASSSAEYHQRAIQIHGRSKFEGRTAHQVLLFKFKPRGWILVFCLLSLLSQCHSLGRLSLPCSNTLLKLESWLLSKGQRTCTLWAHIPSFSSSNSTPLQDDYQAWELPTDEGPAKQERLRPALPFTATSTYADVFTEHPLQPHAKRESPAFKGLPEDLHSNTRRSHGDVTENSRLAGREWSTSKRQQELALCCRQRRQVRRGVFLRTRLCAQGDPGAGGIRPPKQALQLSQVRRHHQLWGQPLLLISFQDMKPEHIAAKFENRFERQVKNFAHCFALFCRNGKRMEIHGSPRVLDDNSLSLRAQPL